MSNWYCQCTVDANRWVQRFSALGSGPPWKPKAVDHIQRMQSPSSSTPEGLCSLLQRALHKPSSLQGNGGAALALALHCLMVREGAVVCAGFAATLCLCVYCVILVTLRNRLHHGRA